MSPPSPLQYRLRSHILHDGVQVGEVYAAITEYAELMADSQGNMDLFDFLAARFG
jgi:hypothetical protein